MVSAFIHHRFGTQEIVTAMKASTERKVLRWIHILFSIPIVGFIYGPVSAIPQAAMMVRWVLFPSVVLSGMWMWKGHKIKKWIKSRKMMPASSSKWPVHNR